MIIEDTINILPHQAPSITERIIKKLESFNLPQNILFDLKLAFNEALINAAKHGNQSDKNKDIYFRLEKKNNKLEILIKDQGQGFDYAILELPVSAENLTKTSGRGIFLIKKFMDEVKYSDGGSKLKMVKYIN